MEEAPSVPVAGSTGTTAGTGVDRISIRLLDKVETTTTYCGNSNS
ncbi:hypothetical protein [Sphaerisporangium rufum]|nr:hypothetical protein [Sphaerisporangium rufum]